MIYLVPSFISENSVETIPLYVMSAVKNCQVIFAENERTARRFLKSMDKGIVIDEKKMHQIYGPVGLDIGAETAEEIALSIIAEIKAVFSKRKGESLKERTSEIHERS